MKLFSPDADKIYAYHVRGGYEISHHNKSSDKYDTDVDQGGGPDEKVLKIEPPFLNLQYMDSCLSLE